MSLNDSGSKRQAEKLGIKVRHLRNTRGLTQKELADGTVSRNMLSMIESGAAFPSLETLMHIADVLHVPAGYFFADGDEELMYGKRDALGTVYRLIGDRRYAEAAVICEPYADGDAEMCLNYALCRFYCALGYLEKSMLASALVHIDAAAAAAAEVPFGGEYITHICSFIRLLADSVSKDVVPDVSAEAGKAIPGGIVAYLSAYRILKGGDPDCAAAIARSGMLGRFHSLHIRGAVLMEAGDYDGATRLFDLALSSDDGGFYSRYKLVCDLELCRKNAGDYESAYALSTSRMEMLGMFSE